MPSFLTEVISKLTANTVPADSDVFLFGNGGGNELRKISYKNLRNKIMLEAHPVGSIYESTASTNPGDLFGGTWETFGAGRVLVGTDSSQTEFNAVKKTGGAKTHTLTVGQLPNVTGQIDAGAGSGGSTDNGWGAFRNASGVFSRSVPHQFGIAKKAYADKFVNDDGYGTVKMSFGSGQAHNNLQPYITVYRWVRTA